MNLTRTDAEPVTLKSVLARHRGRLLASALLAVVSAACSLAPFIAVYATATVLFGTGSDPGRAVVQIAWWTACGLALKATASAAANHVGHVAAYRALADLRLALAEKFRTMPIGRVHARSAGETKKILQDDVEQVEEALAHGVPDVAAAAAVPLATTAALLAVDWRLALVALGSLVLFAAFSAAAIAFAQKNNRALAEHSTELNRTVMGYLRGIKVIRGYLRPDSGYDQAHRAVDENARLEISHTSGSGRGIASGLTVATGLTVAMMLPFAGLRFAEDDIGLGTLILFLVVTLAYLTPVIALVGTSATLAYRFQLAAGAITELLEEETLPVAEEPETPAEFSISFESVTFGYSEGRPAVEDVSLHIPAGESLALVGDTGGGKSTLARLLARFHDPDQGTVRIGGVDIRRIPGDELAQRVAFVQQDEYIFSASLLENIRIARPGATDEEVRLAGLEAQLAEAAEELTDGWNTVLSAGGDDLSGGQRQRIAIARALLKGAKIVVLDEATAALDAITEQRTLEAIERLTAGRTVISIAHRLATIEHSHSIAYVSAGRITAQGPHRRLLAEHEPYRRLWEAYEQAEGWRLSPATDALPAQPRPAPWSPAPSGTSETAHTAEEIVRPNVGDMDFCQQWNSLYGRSWRLLCRQGVIRLLAEGAFRGAPLFGIFLVVLSGVGAGPRATLNAEMVWWTTLGVIGAMLLRLVAANWANVLVWRLAAESRRDLQLSVLERLRRVPMGFFGRVDSGRIGTLICNDLPMLDFRNIPQQVVGSLVQPLYATVILLILDWRLALSALAGLPVFWLLTVLSDWTYQRVFADVHAAREEATSALLEQARGAAVLRSNPNSPIGSGYQAAVTHLREASTSMAVRTGPASAMGAASIECGLVLVIYQPMQELSSLTGYRRNQQQIAAKLGEVWDAPVLEEPSTPATPEDTSVRFQEVSFSYDGTGEALSGVSFTAEAGEVTALVGSSGAGKSTVAHLAGRLWDPSSGSVCIGGADLRNLGTDQVTQLVSTVYQEVYLFDESVRFNVSLGRPDASEGEVWEALAAAQCDDVVAALPDGLDTVLHEGGSDLSGGQRQRLAIARALLKDSPILILDEAVAAVDPATEGRIQKAVARLAAGRTVLVIAHRLSTVQNAGKIVVVDDGRAAQTGTHEQLLESSAVYRRLAEAQGMLTGALSSSIQGLIPHTSPRREDPIT